MNKNRNKKEIYAYILFVVIFFMFCLLQISKPILSDQTYFAWAAHSILKTGSSYFNMEGYGFGQISGFAHPPLYLYLLVLSSKIFGYNLFGLKIVSIFFAILTSLVLFIYLKKIYPEKKGIGLIASIIYLLHPFVIQNSIILDIDGGILSFFTIWTVLYFIKNKMNKFIPFVVLLFFVFITKLTSIIILFLTFFLFIIFFQSGKIRKTFRLTSIFLVAGLIFILIFWVLTLIVHENFFKPFSQNTTEKFSQRFMEGLFESFARSLYSFKDFIIWLTPPLALYLFFVFLRFGKRTLNRRKDEREQILILFILSNFLFFCLTGVEYIGFAKHYILIVPALAILIAKDIIEYKNKISKIEFLLIPIIMLTTINYYFFIIKDPFFTPDVWMVYQNFDYSAIWAVLIKIILIILPIFFIYLILKDIKKSLIIASLSFIAYASVFTAVSTYSTNIHYGDYGLNDAVSYVENLTEGKNSTIIGLYQFSYVYNKGGDLSEINNNAYMYPSGNYYLYGEDFFNKIKITPNNTYLIIYPQDKYRRPGIKEHLEKNFTLVKQIGYYQIYKYNY